MPEIDQILRGLNWEKGQGPNYYFPSAASRPHFHLGIRDPYAQADYLQPIHLHFLTFSHRVGYGGQALPNLHFIQSVAGVACRSHEFDANHLVVREFIGGVGQEHVDALHRSVYPVLNAVRPNAVIDRNIFPDL